MLKQDSGRSRQPKSVTRSLILEKAYEMYVARELIHGDERLSVVLESLGYTTGAGYQIWPNQAAFRQDLQVFIAEQIDYDSLVADLGSGIADVEANVDDTELILAIGEEIARRLTVLEHFYLSLRFFSMGSDRPIEVTEALDRGYRRVEDGFAATFDRLVVERGRTYRPDIGPGDLARSVIALCEGYALRSRVDANLASVSFAGRKRHPFAVALLAVFQGYTMAAATN